MMAKNITISTSNFFSPAAAPNAIPSAVVGGWEDGEGVRMGRWEDGEGGRMGKVGGWEGGKVGGWEGGRMGRWEDGKVGGWEGRRDESNMLIIYIRVTLPAE